MHHITSPNTLEANFTWELRDWRLLAEYCKNQKEKVETSIKSPYFVTEKGAKWQMTMTFKKQEEWYSYPIEFKCYCVSMPTHNPKEDFLKIRGKIQTFSFNNYNSQSAENNRHIFYNEVKIDEFITEAPLQKSWNVYSHLPEDFKIEANFTIGGWKTSEDDLAPKVAKPQLPSLLASNAEFCDVTVVVGGQEIPAHKAVLAVRSPVLKAMLSANMKEKQESKIVLKDASVEGWRMFQQFLYTDNFGSSLALDLPLLAELLMLSDKYQVTAMRDDVGAKIMRSMTVKNVFEVIELVEPFELYGVNEKASEIIKDNFASLRKKKWFTTWLTSGSALSNAILGNCI